MIKVVSAEGSGGFSTAPSGFASVETYGVRRRVKIIGVLESELDTLSTLNTQATIWLSVATALGSLAVGIWVTAAFSDQPTPAGEVLSRFGAWVLVGLALVAGLLSFLAWWKRRKTVIRISAESLPPPSPTAPTEFQMR